MTAVEPLDALWDADEDVEVPGLEVSNDVRGRSFCKMITGRTDGQIMVRRCLVTFKPFR